MIEEKKFNIFIIINALIKTFLIILNFILVVYSTPKPNFEVVASAVRSVKSVKGVQFPNY